MIFLQKHFKKYFRMEICKKCTYGFLLERLLCSYFLRSSWFTLMDRRYKAACHVMSFRTAMYNSLINRALAKFKEIVFFPWYTCRKVRFNIQPCGIFAMIDDLQWLIVQKVCPKLMRLWVSKYVIDRIRVLLLSCIFINSPLSCNPSFWWKERCQKW